MHSERSQSSRFDTHSGLAMALTLIAGCSVLLSENIGGESGEIKLVDDEWGIELQGEEDCESSVEGQECEYEFTVSGGGSYDYEYNVTLLYPGSGGITVLEASIVGSGNGFDGEFEIVPSGLAEGDAQTETEDGNKLTVEFDDASATAEDADGTEYSGCKKYDFLMGHNKTKAEATLCPTIGIVELTAELGHTVKLVREP